VQWACDAVGVGLIKEIPIAILTWWGEPRRWHKRTESIYLLQPKHAQLVGVAKWETSRDSEDLSQAGHSHCRVFAYSPIGQGLLLEGCFDGSKFQNIWAIKMMGVTYLELLPLRSQLQTLSQKHKCTMVQVAIKLVRSHGAVSLIGCCSVQQVEDVADSLEINWGRKKWTPRTRSGWVCPSLNILCTDDPSLWYSFQCFSWHTVQNYGMEEWRCSGQ
jgi:hypothetical protein